MSTEEKFQPSYKGSVRRIGKLTGDKKKKKNRKKKGATRKVV